MRNVMRKPCILKTPKNISPQERLIELRITCDYRAQSMAPILELTIAIPIQVALMSVGNASE
jgi:hypothetical protein